MSGFLRRLSPRHADALRPAAPLRAIATGPAHIPLAAPEELAIVHQMDRLNAVILSCAESADPTPITAWLRDRFNANEILVSLMLVYVATLLLNYTVFGPWKDPGGYNFPQTKTFETVTQVPRLMQGSRQHFYQGRVWEAISSRLMSTLKGDPDLQAILKYGVEAANTANYALGMNQYSLDLKALAEDMNGFRRQEVEAEGKLSAPSSSTPSSTPTKSG